MKAFNEFRRKTVRRTGLILLLAEKWRKNFRRDEHDQIGILTPDLTSLPPSRFRSGLWESVIRYSGATVAESHGVPCGLIVFN